MVFQNNYGATPNLFSKSFSFLVGRPITISVATQDILRYSSKDVEHG